METVTVHSEKAVVVTFKDGSKYGHPPALTEYIRPWLKMAAGFLFLPLIIE